ncbi:hypothetical protein ACN47E_003530 [Coniothyrium glycines]
MPPKPPIRIPTKPIANVRPKSIPLSAPKSLPRSQTPNSNPSSQSRQWHQHPTLRTSARFLTYGTNGILTICALIWLRDHYAELQHVRGSSMAPTLSPTAHETGAEDWVVIRPYMERSAKKQKAANPYAGLKESDNVYGVQRGDVVTFWKPHKPEEMGIKRVVAVEGDTVYPVRGYAVERDAREGRVKGVMDGLGEDDGNEGRVVVPHGHVWLEGDNWRKSLDSNDFGPVSKGLILGKAVWVWKSWFRFERVGDRRLEREERERSRVVYGQSEIPAAFLG